MKSILVYSDEGVSPRSLKQLLHALKDHAVTRVDRHSVIQHLDHASLLVMPGGRDIPYFEALKGAPNQAIRSFVERGGSYLGLCAGGYYGSAEVVFERGYPLEVIGQRELAFFPGTAEGPAYGKGMFQYQSESGSRIAQLDWGNKIVGIYYNGGCYFSDVNKHANTSVLARYADIPEQPAAIIQCQVGKGMAILSGVHPEYDDRMPNGSRIKNHTKDIFLNMLDLLLCTENSLRKTH